LFFFRKDCHFITRFRIEGNLVVMACLS
jgi:hypothetical protein